MTNVKNTLYVVDLDRTLLNVDVCMSLFKRACEEVGMDYSIVDKAWQESKGRSFSPLKVIEVAYPDKTRVFKQKFIDLSAQESILYIDGQRFLDRLRELKKPFLILTYAADVSWQELKLQASRLENLPCLIVETTDKAKILHEWLQADAKFIPSIGEFKPADELVFIDDKLAVFNNLPERTRGFLVDRNDLYSGEQLPPSVEKIENLDAATKLLLA